MLAQALLAASRRPGLRAAVVRTPATRRVVDRFVPGETLDDAASSWEVQMLHGIRSGEQRRLAAAGTTVRAYVPYGADWYGYVMRRLAERPADVGFSLRSLLPRS